MGKYLSDERETILRYDYVDRKWYVWTNVPSHIRKLTDRGWKQTKCTYSEGTIIDAEFEAPKNAVTFRDPNKKRKWPDGQCDPENDDSEEDEFSAPETENADYSDEDE